MKRKTLPAVIGSVFLSFLCCGICLPAVGRVKEKYSDAAVNHILDNVYRYVEKDPYRAYKTYINDFYFAISFLSFSSSSSVSTSP